MVALVVLVPLLLIGVANVAVLSRVRVAERQAVPCGLVLSPRADWTIRVLSGCGRDAIGNGVEGRRHTRARSVG